MYLLENHVDVFVPIVVVLTKTFGGEPRAGRGHYNAADEGAEELPFP